MKEDTRPPGRRPAVVLKNRSSAHENELAVATRAIVTRCAARSGSTFRPHGIFVRCADPCAQANSAATINRLVRTARRHFLIQDRAQPWTVRQFAIAVLDDWDQPFVEIHIELSGVDA